MVRPIRRLKTTQTVTSSFFDELSELLDWVATVNDALFVVGDFNIRLDRPDDVHTQCLRNLLECYDLTVRNTGPTHEHGCQLDVVVTVVKFRVMRSKLFI